MRDRWPPFKGWDCELGTWYNFGVNYPPVYFKDSPNKVRTLATPITMESMPFEGAGGLHLTNHESRVDIALFKKENEIYQQLFNS